MANLWRLLLDLGKKQPEEQRDADLSFQDYVDQYMQYQGTSYMLGGVGHTKWGNKQEAIGGNFEGYVRGGYSSSSIVFACHQARSTVFSEARFSYQKLNNGRPGDLYEDPGAEVLLNPSPGTSTSEFLARALQDVDFAGNHFAVRKDGPEGPRIYRLRPDWVTIVMSKPPEEAAFVDVVGYMYRPGNGEDQKNWEWFPVTGENGAVAHWAPIPDPLCSYRGMSWMTPVLREVQSDKAITSHKLRFFENGTQPGLVFTFPETVSHEKFREFIRTIDETKAGSANAYENLYMGGGADVTTVAAQILDFKQVGSISENRIASAARVHPAIVGLSDGLQGSSLNFGNYESARHQLADGTIRPLWRGICDAYKVLVPEIDGSRLWYDDRDIPFLAEDHERRARTQQLQATTISRFVMQGFKPETATLAVAENNLALLEHTGLYSVQLLPPDVSHPDGDPDAEKDEDEEDLDDEDSDEDDADKDEDEEDDQDEEKDPKASTDKKGSDKQVGPYRKPKKK